MKRAVHQVVQSRVRSGFLLGLASLLSVASLVSVATAPAYAISQNDLNSILNGTPFFDPNATDCIGSSGTTTLSGGDNVQKALNYFTTNKGLQSFQAAGIVGNLMEESGVNPNAVQSGGGIGSGIAQWSVGQRWDGKDASGQYVADSVYGFANGRDVHDLGVQLDFIWWELTQGPYTKVLSDLKGTSNVDDATKVWMNDYGKPDAKVAHLDIRQQDAQDALNKYGDSVSATSLTSAGCTGSGDYVTNFIEYKQCNDAAEHISVPWANMLYGKATICAAGCGPSAMAMIITNMTGQQVTPDMTASYGAAHGTAADDGFGGSFWSIADIVGSHWGLKAQEVGFDPSDIPAINKALRGGALILATGRGPLPFSDAGHFLVVRAVTADGNWLLGNSMVGIGNTLKTEYDPQQLTTSTGSHHDAWILTKAS